MSYWLGFGEAMGSLAGGEQSAMQPPVKLQLAKMPVPPDEEPDDDPEEEPEDVEDPDDDPEDDPEDDVEPELLAEPSFEPELLGEPELLPPSPPPNEVGGEVPSHAAP
jgi:hypothetical protein